MKIIILLLVVGVLAWLIHEQYQPVEQVHNAISIIKDSAGKVTLTNKDPENNAISIIKDPTGRVILTNKDSKDRGISTTKGRTAEQVATNRRCDGRTYCSQMTSCEEATWFLRNCPGTKMDGNHDGVPCEQQWCH
jgi:hypothetical protein